MKTYAIQERAVSENPNAGPQGRGWQEDVAYTLEARNKVQAICGIPSPMAANDNAPLATAIGAPLTYLSVCSGIEAATAAWHQLGWRAVAYSEIEKFPSAVLAHHYPGVPNLGDFTKIDTRGLGRVDILAGGTPCQAFSVAGLRQSLADARGNLSLEFVRLAHELADGNGLRNVVWENVVGVLSTKDNAFGCFLAGLVGADDPISPPSRGKWPRHGMVAGPKGRAAWAVKDAQFFGVAQRRRRVIVVADFGNGADPAAVLFEPEGVFRHPPARGEAGQDVAATVTASAGGVSGKDDIGGRVTAAGFGATGDGYWREGLGPLRARPQDSHEQLAVYAPEIARCDATREGSSQDYESTTMVAVGVHGSISHTLKAEGADASEDGTGRGTPVIAFTAKDYGADAAYEISPTLRSGNHDGSHANGGVMPAVTVALRGREGGATAELGGSDATALRASQGGGDKPHVLTEVRPINSQIAMRHKAMGERTGFGVGDNGDPSFTLTKAHTHAVQAHTAVRRLTPMECERLQGFPDGYTRIPMRAYATKKVTRTRPDDMWEFINGKWWLMASDGPRYKALGNSWAVPKFVWLGKRIARLMPSE